MYFTDGQKIAIRLARRISVVTKMLKKNLTAYNSDIDVSSHLSWSEATDLSSEFYRSCLFSDSTIPDTVKHQAVQHYHQIARAKEELARIKGEMANCVNHYISTFELLMKQVEFYGSQEQLDLCNLGKLGLVKRAQRKCLHQLRSLECFYEYTELDQLKSALTAFSDELQDELIAGWLFYDL